MIQHVEGNSLRLKEDVMELLQLGKKDVVVNPSNGHVVVRVSRLFLPATKDQ